MSAGIAWRRRQEISGYDVVMILNGSRLSQPFNGPLTSEDIARLNQGMNELISEQFPQGKARDHLLAIHLPGKIQTYIGLAGGPDRSGGAELVEAMLDLLALVNTYYVRNA